MYIAQCYLFKQIKNQNTQHTNVGCCFLWCCVWGRIHAINTFLLVEEDVALQVGANNQPDHPGCSMGDYTSKLQSEIETVS
eukprot:NODE_4072_length_333_cov_69.419014_g3990_i0.p1 GENE.NODE_4072_length_333_cov_69.419014_g3990_i0~~NODE_4072_length_333_cov_69.419014_g3990_i0.p1  ORF type:complete len:81 (+),score=16.69 NODE_4072_length_333_cov_69.419014_g3990_i0:39-281(+)